MPDRTDWHNIVLWKGLAKIAEKYVHKGDKLYIEGRLRYRTYDDKKGARRYVTEIVGENMELLSPRPLTQEPSVSYKQEENKAPQQGQDDEIPF